MCCNYLNFLLIHGKGVAFRHYLPLLLVLINKQTPNSMAQDPGKMKAYWKKNLKTLFFLLLVWFVVSFGFGILLVEELNSIRLGGYKLGFWFAQQGSIYAFVVLIFIYVYRMNKLDKEFDVDEE